MGRLSWLGDDITFCMSKCKRKTCDRHPSKIRNPKVPHSFAEFKGTQYCPYRKRNNEQQRRSD